MARFVLIPSPFVSHIRVFEALADRLVARGHHVAFLVNDGVRRHVVANAELRSVREEGRGGLEAIVRRAARPSGPFGILRTVADVAALTDALCRDGPAILGALKPDMLVGDEMEPATGLLAEHLRLPYASVAAALPIDPAPGIPLPYLSWSFDPSPDGLKRNRGGETVARLFLRRQRRVIEAWAGRFGLAPRGGVEDWLSPTLRIAQTVPGFDFPRPASPIFHAVGPIRAESPLAPALPLAIERGRPLVFLSFGTMQGHRLGLFRRLVRGAHDHGAQVLLAHCGRLGAKDAARTGADHVTDFVSLPAVMRQAALCITHGGLNTVMDALAAGVPLLVVPIAFDQPGVAARVVHHGVGEARSRVMVSCGRAEASIGRLLASSTARAKAAAIGREIAEAGGAELAVDLIENALKPNAVERQVALA
ncbi:oleandomycin glycosyltransferase [Aureimonas endophytica]|uniref:Oleandomycin glycosyltransferase n=1 Tax=Aureimonas endophytica TaxID=2027858 RepID=A0A916ZJ64_9HYPH|nr:glycosyltransferase [Aureimonas endophytica]GGD99860.1 oleandomycin glycosyltransferase [Aureimonas endophytica]